MSTEEILSSLTEHEATVLFWKCRGLKYDQIGDRLGYSVEWVTLQMSYVYSKLGFDNKLHWTKRKEKLEEEICPVFSKLTEDNPASLKKFPLSKEAIKEEPQEDPQMMALVLYDEMQVEEAKKTSLQMVPPTIINVPARTNPVTRLLRLLIFSVLLLVALAVVGYFAFQLGSSTQISPTQILPEASQPPNEAQASATFSLEPTTISTDTPIPTHIPTPSPTLNPNIFFDDFEDGLDPAWVVVMGKPSIANGKLSAVETTVLSIGDSSWRDYEIEFDIKIPGTRCSLSSSSEFLGVRATDLDNMLLYLFAWCDAEWKYLANGEQVAIPNTHTTGLKEVHVVVRVEGNKITVHRQSELITSFIDEDYQSGYVYLRIKPDSLYDNFKITLLNR